MGVVLRRLPALVLAGPFTMLRLKGRADEMTKDFDCTLTSPFVSPAVSV